MFIIYMTDLNQLIILYTLLSDTYSREMFLNYALLFFCCAR